MDLLICLGLAVTPLALLAAVEELAVRFPRGDES